MIQNDCEDSSEFRSVLPLHLEILHILVRKDAGMETLIDLNGKRINIGPKESGTRRMAMKLFEHFNISSDKDKIFHSSLTKASEALLNNEIDALIFLGGMKPKVCVELLASGKVKLIGIDQNIDDGSSVRGFCLNYPYAKSYLIPKHSYSVGVKGMAPEPQLPIATLSIGSTLMTRSDLPSHDIYQMTRFILENRSALMRIKAAAAQISDSFNNADLPFPLHEGAKRYIERKQPGFLLQYAETMAFFLSL